MRSVFRFGCALTADVKELVAEGFNPQFPVKPQNLPKARRARSNIFQGNFRIAVFLEFGPVVGARTRRLIAFDSIAGRHHRMAAGTGNCPRAAPLVGVGNHIFDDVHHPFTGQEDLG